MMKPSINAFLFAVTVSLALLGRANAFETMIIGEAIITDGDSLKIAGHKIRLYGIDAPERKQTCELGTVLWRCGEEAKATLANLSEGFIIQCQVTSIDRYKRSIAICKRGDGLELNQTMVALGMAIAYRKYSTRTKVQKFRHIRKA